MEQPKGLWSAYVMLPCVSLCLYLFVQFGKNSSSILVRKWLQFLDLISKVQVGWSEKMARQLWVGNQLTHPTWAVKKNKEIKFHTRTLHWSAHLAQYVKIKIQKIMQEAVSPLGRKSNAKKKIYEEGVTEESGKKIGYDINCHLSTWNTLGVVVFWEECNVNTFAWNFEWK